MTTHHKTSPLMDLAAKKALLEGKQLPGQLPLFPQTRAELTEEMTETKPTLIGPPPEAPVADLEDLRTEATNLLTQLQNLGRQFQTLTTAVQDLAAKMVMGPAVPGAAGGLGAGNIAKPMWVTDHAVDLLKSHTGKPWTRNKLMAVAVSKGWRSHEKGHKPLNTVYVTVIVSNQYKQPTLVYTEVALQHIIDHADACWQLATSVKV